MEIKRIILEPEPMPFFFNLSWEEIWDSFDYEHPFLNHIELDMYGNPIPEQFTQLFRSITEHAEDNVW